MALCFSHYPDDTLYVTSPEFAKNEHEVDQKIP